MPSTEYYQENREKIKLAQQEWYQKNKHKIDKEKKKLYQKEWRQNNKEKIKKSRKEWFLRNPDQVKKKKQVDLINAKIRHQKDKEKVFKYYSGDPPKCSCCGESYREFLTIDHINGGGTKHREEIGYRNIYGWLVRNNFPPEYRILCMNCNFALGQNGYCPHAEFGNLHGKS